PLCMGMGPPPCPPCPPPNRPSRVGRRWITVRGGCGRRRPPVGESADGRCWSNASPARPTPPTSTSRSAPSSPPPASSAQTTSPAKLPDANGGDHGTLPTQIIRHLADSRDAWWRRLVCDPVDRDPALDDHPQTPRHRKTTATPTVVRPPPPTA